ncbi:MAG: radical SAM protein [Myxococcota bacterium]|nr:radical SAM protein [Myxococcota bacterium]
MKKTLGAVLVHGYTGSAEALARLAARLEDRNPALSTTTVGLHQCAETAAMAVPRPPAPRFDAERFVDIVKEACEAHREAGRDLLLIGHSTGGSMAIEALAELLERGLGWTPLLVVLASVPGPLEGAYAARWHQHLGGRGAPGTPFAPPTLADMGRLARLVESATHRRFPQRFPVLVLHGELDELVPLEVSSEWLGGRFALPPRHALVLGAGHNPFDPKALERAADLIERDLADASAWFSHSRGDVLFSLGRMEPTLGPFFQRQPLSARHVVDSPAGWRAMSGDGEGLRLPKGLREVATTDPILLNVEVTTRGPLSCPSCARTSCLAGDRAVQDLSKERLTALLGILPTAARVTFVGPGEPLCHPEIDRLVAISSEAARRTAVVTNAVPLSPDLCKALLEAGVDAVTFRLDALSPQGVRDASPGAELGLLTENIRRFVELARAGVTGRVKRTPSLTMFASLAGRLAKELGSIVDLAVSLGLDALMVSDLNFGANQDPSLAPAAQTDAERSIRSAIAKGRRMGLPIVGLRAIEEIGPSFRPKDVLLLSADKLWTRAAQHSHCLSPWQSLAVKVDGSVAVCDCRPGCLVGNVFEQPLSEVWNGQKMHRERAAMTSPEPPADCRICPRF